LIRSRRIFRVVIRGTRRFLALVVHGALAHPLVAARGRHSPCIAVLARSAMANVLIVFATKEGQSGKVARYLAAAFKAFGHVVELHDAEHDRKVPDFARPHAAVVCAPIHARGYPRAIVRFVRKHKDFLESIPSAFLSVGLAVLSKKHDGRAQTQAIVEKFVKRSGWRPRRVELVAGALPYTRYNFLLRFIMRRISASEGGDTDTSRDYEYTDWSQLDRFATEFVGEASDAALAS
jgi:menaquinone-dependent protoporphyrinogen oxidase